MGLFHSPSGQFLVTAFGIFGVGLLWGVLRLQMQLSLEITASIVTPIALFVGCILPFPSDRIINSRKNGEPSSPVSSRRVPF
jgi:hypothetical protein